MREFFFLLHHDKHIWHHLQCKLAWLDFNKLGKFLCISTNIQLLKAPESLSKWFFLLVFRLFLLLFNLSFRFENDLFFFKKKDPKPLLTPWRSTKKNFESFFFISAKKDVKVEKKKKSKNSIIKYFNQLSGTRSTQTLVEIHNKHCKAVLL